MIEITREKLYATPGRAARFAWRWSYTVTVPGEPYPFKGETLAWAQSIAKEYAARTGMTVREVKE